MCRGLLDKLFAWLAVGLLLASPALAQTTSPGPAGPPSGGTATPPAPSPGQTASPAAQGGPPASAGPVTAPPEPPPARQLSLGADYSSARKWFPNPLPAYTSANIAEPSLTNSERLARLIQGGKLMLSLNDAVSLALENNLAIAVERYTPWLDQVTLLRAQSGAGGLVPFDPTFTGNFNIEESNTPLNNPIFAGIIPTGTTAVPTATVPLNYIQHLANVNFQYTQYFPTGTELQVGMTNNRTSTNFGFFNLFNPDLQSALTIQITQPLLRGFGKLPNTRLIIEARNTQKIGLSQLAQQVIATVTQVSNDYWELVYARENVKVEDAAVQVSQQLYNDNKDRFSIGTLASLDVLTAQSQLASDRQAFVQAQSVQLQDETTLLNDIAKDPLDTSLMGAEIVPTTPIATPNVTDMRVADAVKEAWSKRPELQQMELSLKNAGIEVQASKNELLPSLNVFGEYIGTGLSGVQNTTATTATGAFVSGVPVVNAAGTPIPGLFEGTAVTSSSQYVFPGGLGEDLNRMIRGDYPSFEVGVNLNLPIRNRAAQADNAQALLNQRLQQTQFRQEQNTIFVNVRNALIALQEDRASLAAAQESRQLAVQTFNDEQDKYRLGASTSYNVVLRSRDVTTAEGTELRVSINMLEDELRLNQAMGRTLDVNNITLSDALQGKVTPPSNIPGRP